MILKVCVGSACHIKGSYDVIKIITKIIEEEGLEKEVELKACFCLNNCTEGVSVVIEGEESVYSFSREDAEEKFKKIIRERGL
ncbi:MULTISPECIES: (2Fe-2S) ferredoxin domain-containing protein [Psychrilyobacter]|uniref:(2Fe-2S) ferredoxin domain-containing protein n=1 Tax=Psychrilyobacter piezotolerans TaxID=2293438 RepID=A0ABX9KKT9_9FUSO|nr:MULTISPECIES: (2Fe-2S) ferredoxin domain-containing protein [Psychrilyobacter]MCS5421033.1 (2Fe-2S) ferredoxin domain-containing protein [Psychrilyobacter sp. S5]NDI76312.1 (2Fe-2S) ferredoxin domain-containing protein [Psychrilyobacter piezotolerans]RDE65911.1 (2Fe-2S) ferredoxin domain-containing protein [Psychrilyobacter sp. S5]REI43089.1 (2Fe-2S) ferredoxin domain-containing protein [Psychrilyobacter piezotolerans]